MIAAKLVELIEIHATRLTSDVAQDLPRLFLLEVEYLRTMHNSELAWVSALIDELRRGVITWNADWLAAAEAGLSSTNEETG